MHCNKDDALKCLKIGKDAMETGHRSRALKFLEKPRRLDPSLPIDDLVSDLNNQAEEEEEDSSRSASANVSPDPSDQPSLRQRPSSSSTTEEQRAIVREIKSKEAYYEILGLRNTCSVEDVRKAYRKLSLKIHPDRNKAHGSEEAFKSISKAFQCLSNEDARRMYDVVGCSYDEPAYLPRRQQHDDEFSGMANQGSDDIPRVVVILLLMLPVVLFLLAICNAAVRAQVHHA
ncbi:DNAJ heat shock N-terminal domain-containing protein [Raphanus sativus]|uniref:Chaperone protein dnaJ 49-like n=1 Tax=Raphanus sativus TaxID=3726 RepID=A0A6J0M6G9_RAPSA|nr:chaperone protein dnaJ 49-like [Raphanus sativus]KAJ4911674.1 DNAJ heat shock N-terminal domain-containing protein [Raphanus sativus]